MELGATIKKCRTASEKTLDSIAEETGLSKGYLSLVESNKREPSLSTVSSIAAALGIPMEIIVFMAAREDEIWELDKEQLKQLKLGLSELVSES